MQEKVRQRKDRNGVCDMLAQTLCDVSWTSYKLLPVWTYVSDILCHGDEAMHSTLEFQET